MSWQLSLWSISFCLGILCIQLQPAFFLAYPAAHIPIRAFVVDIISSSEEFAHLLCVCARLGLRKFCAGDNSPSRNPAATCCEIPRRCAATQSPDPRTPEHSASLPVGTLISWGHPKCEDCVEGRGVSDVKTCLYRTGTAKLIACNRQIFQ